MQLIRDLNKMYLLQIKRSEKADSIHFNSDKYKKYKI